MERKLRIGIIGAGTIGPIHAQAIMSLPDAQLVAVTDTVTEKAERLAATYHLTAYTNIQDMLQQEKLDIAHICTPSGLHATHACQALRAGCHVIVEKPLEITLARIDEILQVQRQTGRKLAVISQHRFDNASIYIKKLLDEKALGNLVMGNATIPWWRSQTYYDSGAWRGTWALDGGGTLMNQSIHSIDLLQWFMGPVHSLHAYTGTRAHQMECEDVAVIALRFANGALGTISATTGAYPGMATRIEIYGDQGSVIIENDQLHSVYLADSTTARADQYKANTSTVNIEAGPAHDPAALQIEIHARQIADMLHAIREDTEPLVDGYAARHSVEIILGAYESARTGKEVILA